MDGVNKVILIGSVGQDPKTKVFQGENQVTTFSLATNSSYKDKDGNKQTKVEWHTIELWNGKSKFASEFVKKGMLVYIEGYITYGKSEKDEKVSYWTKIKVDEIKLFPKGPGSSSANNAPTESVSNSVAQAAQQANAYTNGNEAFNSQDEEDLPF
jgi:single-strand DNA-binding protein